eukprot:GHVP01025604.1.p1 GENE.GHVP01025604.1~~GHVP01025604.1.p1  ORF type:complete len:151 (+),score=21.20 GHVP01025604.1:2-454(+)
MVIFVHFMIIFVHFMGHFCTFDSYCGLETKFTLIIFFRSAIITGVDESFCERIYQFENQYFAIKAHVDLASTDSDTIIVDDDSCAAACGAECSVSAGCTVERRFPQYAGQLESATTTTSNPEVTTSEPEVTEPEDSAFFAASFLLAMLLV